MYKVVIKKHEGKRKNYYTVHLLLNNENFRIFGKYSSLNKAIACARNVAKNYNLDNYEIR